MVKYHLYHTIPIDVNKTFIYIDDNTLLYTKPNTKYKYTIISIDNYTLVCIRKF